MHCKLLYVALVAFVLLRESAVGKKTKKNKRTKPENEDTTPQPNVIAYSTFGFNDVKPYDGFVPSSPDFASYLSNTNMDSNTRLYAPAFPTASDTEGFSNTYDYPTHDGQNLGSTGHDNTPQSSMLQYAQSPMNFIHTPELDNGNDQNKHNAFDDIHVRITNELNAPVYGTKLSVRGKDKALHQFNHSEPIAYASDDLNQNSEKYSNFYHVGPTHEPIHFGESSIKNQVLQPYGSAFTSNDYEHYSKPSTNPIKFPKLIDFTKMNQYISDIDNNKLRSTTPRPSSAYNSFTNVQSNENSYSHTYEDFTSKIITPSPSLKNNFDVQTKYGNEQNIEESLPKLNSNHDQFYNYANSIPDKNAAASIKVLSDHKKKLKKKPWLSHDNIYTNNTNDFINWNDPFSTKGYEYSTNFSNTSFKFGVSEPKKPFGSMSSVDEIEPASSNLVDLTNYQFPDSDYSSFKKIPDVKFDDDDDFISSYKEKFRSPDYSSQLSNVYSTVPTTTSFWGNSYKSSDFSSFKKHPKRNPFSDEISENIVNISPKRPNKLNSGRPSEGKPSSWFNPNQRPYRLFKPNNDWPQEIPGGRYTSEEDLLDIRNHDTSHPSYLPTFKYTKDDEKDFKKVVDKWRQSYLKSKYKNLASSDFESFPTESKPYHVPIPKPYSIEIPHPVIIPVPQPYPVRVPVSKPVAVPIIKELTIPIEKPVPYAVIKKVPYPVEKLVPVRVEKEVKVPVEKPYPVAVPYIRPVFHHTKGLHDERESEGDDSYRPDSSKRLPHYRKRPYGTRNRSKRPTRNSHQDRNSRRWPDRRQPSTMNKESRHRRPVPEYPSPYKHHDFDSYEDERGDYMLRCKRNGDC